MRRLIFPVSGLVLSLALVACKRDEPAPVVTAPAVELVSVLNMSDPQTATQLTKGFYGLENNNWRWAASKFTVTLRPPAGAAQNGARLDLRITLPEDVFAPLAPMTLTATVGGAALEPEKYTKAGDYVFTRDVPASALSGDKVSIEFATDKAQAPAVDRRELAVIVHKVGLVTK